MSEKQSLISLLEPVSTLNTKLARTPPLPNGKQTQRVEQRGVARARLRGNCEKYQCDPLH